MSATVAAPVTTEPAPPPDARGEVTKGLVALLAVQFCFGLFPVFGTWSFEPGAFTPAAVAFWRICAGALVLGALAALVLRGEALPRRGELPLLFVLSLLSVALNQGFYLEGLKRSSGTATGLVMCLIPVFTYAIALIARQERPRLLRVLGIAIALAGTVPLLVAEDGVPAGFSLGILFLITNALVYSIFLVLAKPVMRRRPPLFLVAWVYLLSTVALPWFAIGADLAPPFAGHERAWWSLAYALVFPTILAYLLNAYALARVNASTTAFFIYLQPAITALGSWYFLGESLSPRIFATAGCMFAGLWLVMRRRL